MSTEKKTASGVETSGNLNHDEADEALEGHTEAKEAAAEVVIEQQTHNGEPPD